ncbi:MAG: hypothetical protein IT292_07705 [Deltaproteobacteria bacterium]|nr:hypothetical protein [Deltaproteobacteria bacterium]
MFKKYFMRLWAICLALIFCSACKEVIWHALEEPKANQVVVALAEAGIKAKKVQDGARWNIAVETSETYRALRTLDKHRLLQRRLNSDSNKNKKLITSREERMRSLEHSLANNLTDTLESLPGVLEAHVHFYFANQVQQEFVKNQPKTSASVVLITKGNPLVTDDHIRNLISGATGIDSTNIKVLFALETNQKNNSSQESPETTERATIPQPYPAIKPLYLIIGVLPSLILIGLLLRKQHKTIERIKTESSPGPFFNAHSSNNDTSVIMPLNLEDEGRPTC